MPILDQEGRGLYFVEECTELRFAAEKRVGGGHVLQVLGDAIVVTFSVILENSIADWTGEIICRYMCRIGWCFARGPCFSARVNTPGMTIHWR